MANAARWVHAVHMDGEIVKVTVGPNRYTTSDVVALGALPRHEIRRVCAHLGLSGAATRSKDEMIYDIVRHCRDVANVGDDGRVSSVRGRESFMHKNDPSSSSDVPSSDDESSPRETPRAMTSLEMEVIRVVDARLDEHGVTSSVDVDAVKRIIDEHVTRPKSIVFRGVETATITERTHFQFEELLARVACRENMFLTGGPGVSKTYMTRQVAKALDVPCVVVSAKPLPQDAEILGYVRPLDGVAVKGAARDVYEHGGVLVLDEIDTAHISLGPSTNNLLSSSVYDFPTDGGGTERVERHPMCIFMATGNTFGRGGNMSFMGTVAMNGASLNRFTYMHIECDETLTLEVMRDTDVANGTDHAARVHEIWTRARRNIENYRLQVVMSPRDAFSMHAFMVGGLNEYDACRGRLYGRGESSDVESKVMDGITLDGAR